MLCAVLCAALRVLMVSTHICAFNSSAPTTKHKHTHTQTHTQAVFPLALPVCRDARGVFVLLSLLDLFSQRIWDDEANCEPALQVCGCVCWMSAVLCCAVLSALAWLLRAFQQRAHPPTHTNTHPPGC